MKMLILAAIRCSLTFLVTASLLCVRTAEAYTVTLQQVGANVVAHGSGAINLTGLTFVGYPGQFNLAPGVNGAGGIIQTGSDYSDVDRYNGFTGPTSFGLGFFISANLASGDMVGIRHFDVDGLFVPTGYVSGTALSDSMTFNNATFASLGVTPGTYVWTWGAGANQNFTLHIGSVPDAGSTLPLLGFASLGLVALRRKLSC